MHFLHESLANAVALIMALDPEVVHAVREEMAVKLMDVVRRRTDLGKRAPAELSVLQRTAA